MVSKNILGLIEVAIVVFICLCPYTVYHFTYTEKYLFWYDTYLFSNNEREIPNFMTTIMKPENETLEAMYYPFLAYCTINDKKEWSCMFDHLCPGCVFSYTVNCTKEIKDYHWTLPRMSTSKDTNHCVLYFTVEEVQEEESIIRRLGGYAWGFGPLDLDENLITHVNVSVA